MGNVPHVTRNTGNQEWYTPDAVLETVRDVLGKIDLDPATSKVAQKRVQAKKYYTVKDNGLMRKWKAKTVFINPPYAASLIRGFAAKLVHHYRAGDVKEAVWLSNNSTDTQWCAELTQVAAAVFFFTKRLRFVDQDGKAGGAPLQGQMLIYIGDDPDKFLQITATSLNGWGCKVE